MATLLLIVRLAGERVAFPAADVEAVVEIDNVVPAPGTPPHVAGLAALRSRVLTVIDCPASLGLPAGEVPHRDAVLAGVAAGGESDGAGRGGIAAAGRCRRAHRRAAERGGLAAPL